METVVLTLLVFVTSVQAAFTTGDPQFDITPLNVTATAGQQAILPCAVLNKGDRQMIWMNPRRVLISTEDRRVIDDRRMSIERPFVRDWNLHIRDVQVSDNGEYQCQINTDPIQIKRIRLTVQVPARIDNSTSSNDTTAHEGTTVKLTCTAEGEPEPTINWYRKTMTGQQAKEHVGTTGEVLIIHNISRHCGGVYECEASNNVAEPVRRQIIVDVAFPPEVYFRTPRKIGQVRGKEAMLECLITAYPNGVSQWKRNGEPVTHQSSWKYRTDVYKEDIYTVALYLRILNLDEGDYGSYTCEASNLLGKDKDTILLYEYSIPTTPKPTTTQRSTENPSNFWRTTRHPGSGQVGNEPWNSNQVIIGAHGSTQHPYRNLYQPGANPSGYVGTGESYSGGVRPQPLSLYVLICVLTASVVLR